MVHALAETWRVLEVGGRLVDVRPYSSGWPLEILTPHTQLLAGPVDDSIGYDLDIASDSAVLEAVEMGWFDVENRDSFEFAYYWDSVDDMNEFLKENWRESATVPDRLLAKARRLEELAAKPAQIRIRRSISIASYRRRAG